MSVFDTSEKSLISIINSVYKDNYDLEIILQSICKSLNRSTEEITHSINHYVGGINEYKHRNIYEVGQSFYDIQNIDTMYELNIQLIKDIEKYHVRYQKLITNIKYPSIDQLYE